MIVDRYMLGLAGAVVSLGTALVAFKVSSSPLVLALAVPALLFVAWTAVGAAKGLRHVATVAYRGDVRPILRYIARFVTGGAGS